MKQCILSLSYGKDSLACLGAIEKLGWKLDRIVHAEIWATDTISADLPPMVEFKKKADAIIKERYGIEVEHIYAVREGAKLTYESIFYRTMKRTRRTGNRQDCDTPQITGFASKFRQYCLGELKLHALSQIHQKDGDTKPTVMYLGIADDEPKRLARLDNINTISPLAAIGWKETDCRKWCEENDLLSPIYTTATRGGCWFCHNQSINQLRLLRKNYPDLWALLMKWDLESPGTFRCDGRTIHNFDSRFQMEDEGKVPTDRTFRWKMIDSIFDRPGRHT